MLLLPKWALAKQPSLQRFDPVALGVFAGFRLQILGAALKLLKKIFYAAGAASDARRQDVSI
ncbi:MAG TPA: hypothetical protein VGO04_09955 [Ensifer sp.]|nr:hypothetical protein [Ensifer sp.]